MFDFFTKEITVGVVKKRVIDWDAVVSAVVLVFIIFAVLSKCSE